MSELDGKTAFVTGGTAGIGLAVARAYTQAGASVTIGGRRDGGEEIAREAGCTFVSIDVASEDGVRDALASVERAGGPIDILVLNAGMAQPVASIENVPSDVVGVVVDVDLLGVVWGLKHGPSRIADGGSVILTSSIAAQLGSATEAIYGAAKAGVSSLARSAAIELGARGIRVNAVQPGPIATDMNQMPDELSALLTPLGRKGEVGDLTGIYVFLGSDASRYVTGQVISVDGGLTAGITPGVLRAVISKARRDATAGAAAAAAS
jgi:NAD(P)-dependent dehydrogenase (short-subunit alcohol dehydrogenase family)